jgi:hypothetical protein
MVTQRRADEHDPEWAAYGPPGAHAEEIERNGVSFSVYRPERQRGWGIPLTVVFAREGTSIELSSTSLDEELLLELAASIERVA